MVKKIENNDTKEKIITFKDLQKLFEANKGKDIKLSETSDKYIIQVYDNMYASIKGNLKTKYSANVHIEFMNNSAVVIPCKYNTFVNNKMKIFKLNDDIMKMKGLVPNAYLKTLVNYM